MTRMRNNHLEKYKEGERRPQKCGNTFRKSKTSKHDAIYVLQFFKIWLQQPCRDHTPLEIERYKSSQPKTPLDTRIVDWIIFAKIPFNAIDNAPFRAMFDHQQVPSRHTLSRLTQENFNKQKQDIIEHFRTIDSKFSFTTDLWSCNFKDFIGITTHYIDSEYQLQHRVIALKQVFSHKGVDVAQAFISCLKEYELINKIGILQNFLIFLFVNMN